MKLNAAIIAGALALVCTLAAAPVRAQSALDFAAAGMGRHEARIIYPLRRHMRRHRRHVAPAVQYAGGSTPLLAVAERYVGSRRFTRWARAWCADAMNAWLRRAGYRGTGDGRAISFARWGRPAGGPRVGSVAVLRHHVGIVAGRERGKIILLSGNHGGRVAFGAYSPHRILAYREPV